MQSKFTKKERLEIGRKIFEREMNQEEAAIQYDINPYTARDYFRLYKATLAVREKRLKPACLPDQTNPHIDTSKKERR